jgi:hypothetical protein
MRTYELHPGRFYRSRQLVIETQSESWGIHGDVHRIEAWSTARLQFEPKGLQIEYRDALRTALRQLRPSDGVVLHGNYATPDQDFADLENVLLYNVGSGAYGSRPRFGVNDSGLGPWLVMLGDGSDTFGLAGDDGVGRGSDWGWRVE